MESAVEKLKERIDIVELIGTYVQLKKAGRNFKGLCPFHQEKTPSFVVSADRQLWRCFGSCGIGGDAIAFFMKMENVSFPEALQDLAQKYGVEIETHHIDNAVADSKKRLISANQKAVEFYHYILMSSPIGKPAREYLEKRGISEKIIKTFRLGYAPSSWDSLSRFLMTKKFTANEIVASGLGIQKQYGSSVYDRFRGRLMFPLMDHRDVPVGFSGRLLHNDEKEAKYVNTPETTLYHKRSMLFGLNITKDAAKKENRIILVEGEFDMITPYQYGVNAIAAIKGSALTTEHLLLIKRFTNRVYLALDADKAGEEAIRRAIEVAEPMGFELGVIQIEGGKDPDEAMRTNEVEFKKTLEKPIPVYDFLLQLFIKKHPPTDPFNKKQIGDEMAPFLFGIANPIVQSYYVKQLAKVLDVSEESAEKVVRSYRRKRYTPYHKNEPSPVKQQREIVLQQYLLEQLLHSTSFQKLKAELTPVLSPDDFSLPSYGKLYKALLDQTSDGQFDINSFVKTLPPEIGSVADELYLKATSDEEITALPLVQTAIEIKRFHLRKKLKDALSSETATGEEDLKRLQAQLKELEKTSSTV